MGHATPNFDLKEEIRQYWSDRAETFDDSPSHRIEDTIGLVEWRLFLRQVFKIPAEETLHGKHVLDIDCGTGEISRVLCSIGAEVTGLDFSDAMHARARQKLASENWKPLLCDAERLGGVPDDTFDYAITRHLAWTLTDPMAAFAEWVRVLKPGGSLVVIDGDWARPLSFQFRLRRWIADMMSPARKTSADDKAKHSSILSRLPYSSGLTVETLSTALTEAGFQTPREVSVHRLYNNGMRALPLHERLRQSSENRFALVATTPPNKSGPEAL
ncbi:MAG: methyltransferase domain-containing protein [Pseudomonadota bacterium]